VACFGFSRRTREYHLRGLTRATLPRHLELKVVSAGLGHIKSLNPANWLSTPLDKSAANIRIYGTGRIPCSETASGYIGSGLRNRVRANSQSHPSSCEFSCIHRQANSSHSSCNDHVTINKSCAVSEVLQYHLRPLSYCKDVKGVAFHGDNTGSNPVEDAKLFH